MGEMINNNVDKISIQILSYTFICVAAYVVTLIVLRVPFKLANFIAGFAFLYSAYYIFIRVLPNS
jgi:hypothetical protein